MKILVVEPFRIHPYVKEIDGSLESMQKVVDGRIEAIYPFDDQVALICNEEGKINGLWPNRTIIYEDHITDTIAGTFFVAGLEEESFGSLTDKRIEFYKKVFSCLKVDVVATNLANKDGGNYGENTD